MHPHHKLYWKLIKFVIMEQNSGSELPSNSNLSSYLLYWNYLKELPSNLNSTFLTCSIFEILIIQSIAYGHP